jgi:hypothetical protein
MALHFTLTSVNLEYVTDRRKDYYFKQIIVLRKAKLLGYTIISKN